MTSVQTGAAVSTELFDRFGSTGTAWMRLCWAAVVLLLVARPRIRGTPRRDLAIAVMLGIVSGFLTVFYFAAIDRIPLGTATALEFLGPLAVAVAGLRRRIDVIWPLAAALGVLALTRPWTSAVNGTGVAFALGAAACWAGYILLTQRVGDRFTGLTGLAISMAAASVFIAPFADVAEVGAELTVGAVLVALGAALLLPILPYACEMLALRKLITAAFGTIMCLEPAIGTIIGAVLLDQDPALLQLAGVALVVTAGIGASQRSARPVTP